MVAVITTVAIGTWAAADEAAVLRYPLSVAPAPDGSLVVADRMALGLARIEAHYFVNDIFLPENSLLANIGRIRHIPATIVQGRYDICTPIMTAWDLHRAWPEAEFVVVDDAGHAASEPGIARALREPGAWVVQERRPDLVLVYGDVNSTVAAALVCAKLLVPVGHVEAGLRSFDRTMPEEINRVLTDQISELLFTPSADGDRNLEREGIAQRKIHLVGNVMIDTLLRMLPAARQNAAKDLPETSRDR